MTKIDFFDNFLRQVRKLKKAKKNINILNDIKALEEELRENPTMGKPLGHNMYKVRMANSSKSIGKRGGFRVITYFLDENHMIYLASIYEKNEIENIPLHELVKVVEEEMKKREL
jgi:mRNA-degrading endonuclease RelE of RelBE toxin-antitoxin system